MTVITRFAPSPTGLLHIGGARTAIFNWLFARHYNGKFLIRIEDTDKKRSSAQAIDEILNGLSWLNLDYNEEIIFQSNNLTKHQKIAEQLLSSGQAYRCYCTPEDLENRKKLAQNNKSFGYDRRCRNNNELIHKPFAIRIKTPIDGKSVINDEVLGTISINNNTLDDFIILRSNETPTYMLSVVVDDFDMNISHIIRGDDHLTNTFKQQILYNALKWNIPKFAHIPLIHGMDGAKLSKRHGALGISSYIEQGILSEAMFNYLLRLGWSHGDDEIIAKNQAVEWFDLNHVGKSSARFDGEKLLNINGHYIRSKSNLDIFDLIIKNINKEIKRDVSEIEKQNIIKGLSGIKLRSKSLIELINQAQIFLHNQNFTKTDKANSIVNNTEINFIKNIYELLNDVNELNWQQIERLEKIIRNFAESKTIKLVKIAQIIRVALTGSTVSPSIFELMAIIGKTESLYRILNLINEK